MTKKMRALPPVVDFSVLFVDPKPDAPPPAHLTLEIKFENGAHLPLSVTYGATQKLLAIARSTPLRKGLN